jgi:hypothetical protein
MKKYIMLGSVVLIPVIAFVAGCASGADEMAKIVQIMERDDPAVFEKAMRGFVDCALKGDVDGMISLTSKVTIAQAGLEALREHYAKDTIPALKRYPKMSDGGRVDYIRDEFGSTGWAYKKVFTSPVGKEAKFQFIVLKEQGIVGVSSFGLWK